jgi:hypothetical protein
MDVVTILAVVVAFLAGLLIKSYLPAYAKTKGQNLATKEDIAEITDQVERVRAAITAESALLERRRNVYGRIANALRIFIAGHGATSEQRQDFHSAYSECWLWAPDDILDALNAFIRMQQEYTAGQGRGQGELKAAFVQIMLRMRRDVGFAQSHADANAYVFVQFADPPKGP